MTAAHPVIVYVLAQPSGPVTSSEPAWWSDRRRGYGAGLRASVQTLRRRHAHLPRVVLLHADVTPTLADVDDTMRIDVRAYDDIPIASGFYGREIYFKLDLFRPRRLERIVYLDCDTVVVGDLSPLWDRRHYRDRAIYAMQETADMGGDAAAVGGFNTGVMVINPPLLPDGAFDRLLTLATVSRGHAGGDQGILNRYLDEVPAIVGRLDPEYNVLVTRRQRPGWPQVRQRARVLHYVNHLKPWRLDHDQDPLYDPDLKREWDEAFAAAPPVASARRPTDDAR